MCHITYSEQVHSYFLNQPARYYCVVIIFNGLFIPLTETAQATRDTHMRIDPRAYVASACYGVSMVVVFYIVTMFCIMKMKRGFSCVGSKVGLSRYNKQLHIGTLTGRYATSNGHFRCLRISNLSATVGVIALALVRGFRLCSYCRCMCLLALISRVRCSQYHLPPYLSRSLPQEPIPSPSNHRLSVLRRTKNIDHKQKVTFQSSNQHVHRGVGKL